MKNIIKNCDVISEVLLDNDDVLEMDFTTGSHEWKYILFSCDVCMNGFPMRRGLNKHMKTVHTGNKKGSRDNSEDLTKENKI